MGANTDPTQNLPARAPADQASNATEGTISLPPMAPPVAALAGSHVGHGLDRFLTVLVLVLAFLTASFPARNSDLWFHLAAGRQLSHGEFAFGADPFAYTSAENYWANHAWLWDLGVYGLYLAAGEAFFGAAVVAIKAVLVSVLAFVLLRVRRENDAVWLPAACTVLALLAMSPRLLVQPACVSYFLLGLTFWLLWNGASSARLCALIVFALWVNVDEWFFLGPLLATLLWLGERLHGQRRTPGWLVLAGWGVCLLNPYTYHAFTLPSELSAVTWSSGLRADVRFQALFASSWEYWRAVARLDAGALAYFALTLLGVLSFLRYRPACRDGRLLVWLPFALLAAWQARAIPFFAVVAAPITALNLQDFLRERVPVTHRAEPRRRQGLLQALLLLSVLALIFLSWSGWLAGYGRVGRRVGWVLQPEPSLRQAAEVLHYWRRQGLLPAGERVMGLAPEVAEYAAWFCPEEKQFFDRRYQLFPAAAADFETVCRAVIPGLTPAPAEGRGVRGEGRERAGGGTEPDGAWREVLRAHRVGIVVFYERDPQRSFALLRRLADDRKHWTLLYLAGHVLIAGWNEARPDGGFAALAFDPERLAFGLQDERARRELPAAPEHGPADLVPERGFWERLVHAVPPPSWESAAATAYLQYFHSSEVRQGEQQLHSLLISYGASLAGLAALPTAATDLARQLVSSHELLFPDEGRRTFHLMRDRLGPAFATLGDRPAALPLLAVRAARRAVAVNPEDSSAWLRLGQAYLLLRNMTGERSGAGLLPPLAQLRHVQIVTALEQAVRLDPDLEAAYHELTLLYGESDFLDRALDHRREEVRLSRRAGMRPGETVELYRDRLELLDNDTAKLAEMVEDRRRTYAANSGRLQGDRLAQAKLALKLGLARTAVEEILLPAPVDLLGAAGLRLELRLLLTLGRAGEVRSILADEGLRAHKHGLEFLDLAPSRRPNGTALYSLPYHLPAYDWLLVLEASAVGDYADAEGALRSLRSGVQGSRQRLNAQAENLDRHARQWLPSLLSGPPAFLPAFAAQILTGIGQEASLLRAAEPSLRAQQADLCVLQGLLALERGAPESARAAFSEAQKTAGEAAATTVRFAGAPIAASYLGKLARSH